MKKPNTTPNSLSEFTSGTTSSNWVTLLLGLTMLMLPAMGAPSEELLQDSFKSAILAFGILIALFVYIWHLRTTPNQLTIHWLVYLLTSLCLYAFGSMAWSHTYLAGVEGIRWFLLALLFIIASNSFEISKIPRLAWGVHIGLTIASLWAALQFWFNFSMFPQGPNPASTFVNRNFFAEYCIGAIPLGLYLLTRESIPIRIYVLTASIAFNLVALLMTGTRSALIALLFSVCLACFFGYNFWNTLPIAKWSLKRHMTCIVIFCGIFGILGSISTKNIAIIQEVGIQTPIQRAFTRTTSIASPTEYSTGSFSVRAAMWQSTLKMIASHPLTGVGAGAWEVHAPLYQPSNSQLEADFYAHNELLQLISEYGLIGWIVASGLIYFLFQSIRQTWKISIGIENYAEEVSIRVFGIFGISILLLVSNAGFPFRLASTGALFIIYLAMLAASNNRIGADVYIKPKYFTLNKLASTILLITSAVCITLASYAVALAVQCESNLVRAVKLALTITNSKQPNNPYWDSAKKEMLDLLYQGIAINSHYRKLTPMAADEMASWGDWENAIGVWESVLQSRPYVIALSANIAKGYMQMGNYAAAQKYIDKAASVQPNAPAVRSAKALLLFEQGQYDKSIPIIRGLLDDGLYDYQLVYAAYLAGTKGNDLPLVVEALQLRIKLWPAEASDAWLKLGKIYSTTEMGNDEKAAFCYRMALDSSPPATKAEVLEKIPEAFRPNASSEH